MTRRQPSVTVLVPALQEEADIAGCLEAVAAQSYPRDLIDVVLVDGCSTDATVRVAQRTAADLGLTLKVVENVRRRTSTSLNAGLAVLGGEIVVRLDARSRVQPTYVERCVDVLTERSEVGVVGGRQVPRRRSDRLLDRAIARALSNRYTTGFARYRRATASGPADTVWMGSFRAEELRALGGWDDEIALNEDWALNAAFREAGQVVWFDADLASSYLPRPDLGSLARQYFWFGRVKGMWWARGMRPAPRQLVLLMGPLAGVGALVVGGRRHRALWCSVPAVLLLADAVGARRPAGPAERIASATAISVYGSSWWAGTVVGAVGEVIGVEHRHRSVPS